MITLLLVSGDCYFCNDIGICNVHVDVRGTDDFVSSELDQANLHEIEAHPHIIFSICNRPHLLCDETSVIHHVSAQQVRSCWRVSKTLLVLLPPRSMLAHPDLCLTGTFGLKLQKLCDNALWQSTGSGTPPEGDVFPVQ